MESYLAPGIPAVPSSFRAMDAFPGRSGSTGPCPSGISPVQEIKKAGRAMTDNNGKTGALIRLEEIPVPRRPFGYPAFPAA